MAMRTTTTIWNKLKNEPMQRANPADLAAQGDIIIPPNTGFCYKLGGGQSWGLYFPKGGEIFLGGMYAADAQHSIEVWDDSVSGKSTKAGRGSSQLEEKTFGIPGFLIGDTGAKGLQFSLGLGTGGNRAFVTKPINIAPFLSGSSGSQSLSLPSVGKTVKVMSVSKPKPGGKAAKIIAFGNWDVVPVYFASKD